MKHTIPDGFIHYIDNTMCRYSSIYPNVLRVLEHLFFVIGNGYDYQKNNIVVFEGKCHIPLHQYFEKKKIDYVSRRETLMIDAFLNSLKISMEIGLSHRKFMGKTGLTLKQFYTEKCKKTIDEMTLLDKPIISQDMFTYQSLREQLMDMDEIVDKKYRGSLECKLPYPMSKGYSICYDMDENSPKWLVEICYNLSSAYYDHINEHIIPVWDQDKCQHKNGNKILTSLQEVIDNCVELLK